MTSDSDEKRDPSGEDARDHSEYAEKDRRTGQPYPRERGDYHDPVKDVTGRGNASKGPWREQGGAGHGENYGVTEKRPDPKSH